MAHTVEVNTPLEALLVEQALAMARELGSVADAAPDGCVLTQAEIAAVRLGREFTRRALEATLQAQADAAEKKGPRAAPVPADAAVTPRVRQPRPR
jgi:hypothetical protein